MASWKRRGALSRAAKDLDFMVIQGRGEVQRSKRVAFQWRALQKYKMDCNLKVLLFPSSCKSTPSTRQLQNPPMFGHFEMSDSSELLGYKEQTDNNCFFCILSQLNCLTIDSTGERADVQECSKSSEYTTAKKGTLAKVYNKRIVGNDPLFFGLLLNLIFFFQ